MTYREQIDIQDLLKQGKAKKQQELEDKEKLQERIIMQYIEREVGKKSGNISLIEKLKEIILKMADEGNTFLHLIDIPLRYTPFSLFGSPKISWILNESQSDKIMTKLVNELNEDIREQISSDVYLDAVNIEKYHPWGKSSPSSYIDGKAIYIYIKN